MKANYETVSSLWGQIIDSYHLSQLSDQHYDLGIKQALSHANQIIQQHGWSKEEFYQEMSRRTPN